MLLLVPRPKYGHEKVHLPHLKPAGEVQGIIGAESVELLGPPQVLWRLGLAKSLAFALGKVVHDQSRARRRSGSDKICGTKSGSLLTPSEQMLRQVTLLRKSGMFREVRTSSG